MTDEEYKELSKQIKETRDLLNYFNIQLSAFDPGCCGVIKGTNKSVDFSNIEWNWLKPLLIELKKLRNH